MKNKNDVSTYEQFGPTIISKYTAVTVKVVGEIIAYAAAHTHEHGNLAASNISRPSIGKLAH